MGPRFLPDQDVVNVFCRGPSKIIPAEVGSNWPQFRGDEQMWNVKDANGWTMSDDNNSDDRLKRINKNDN